VQDQRCLATIKKMTETTNLKKVEFTKAILRFMNISESKGYTEKKKT